jgi:anti-sigma regulatory factor (Ser/Thr protein kinase)
VQQCTEPTNPLITATSDRGPSGSRPDSTRGHQQFTAPQTAPTASHEQSFAGVPGSVGDARAWLEATLQALRVPAAILDSAVLVLSELVTNAVTHTISGRPGGEVTVEALVHHQGPCTELTLRVVDGGAATVPRPRQASPDSEHGRGLSLVEAFTQAWGELTDGRCGVWAHCSWTTLAVHPTWARGWELEVTPDGSGVRAHHTCEDITLVGPDLPSLRERVKAVNDVQHLRDYYRSWTVSYDTSPDGPSWFKAQRREPLCEPARGQVDELTASTAGELRGRLLGQVAADRNADRGRPLPCPPIFPLARR